jgi:hypothetical protein
MSQRTVLHLWATTSLLSASAQQAPSSVASRTAKIHIGQTVACRELLVFIPTDRITRQLCDYRVEKGGCDGRPCGATRKPGTSHPVTSIFLWALRSSHIVVVRISADVADMENDSFFPDSSTVAASQPVRKHMARRTAEGGRRDAYRRRHHLSKISVRS